MAKEVAGAGREHEGVDATDGSRKEREECRRRRRRGPRCKRKMFVCDDSGHGGSAVDEGQTG